MNVPPLLRSLAHARASTLSVALTLALGTCALTMTFAAMNAALLREPPFPEAGRVAMLYLERNPQGESPRRERWSFPRFERLRQQQKSFEDVAAYSPSSFTISESGGATPVNGEDVSPSYFKLLRAQAARGRLFLDGADAGRPAQEVVLAHDLWTRRFGSDPGVLGRTIGLNGLPLTVIGILPEGFRGLSGRADIFVPMSLAPQLTYAEHLTTNENFISAFGRLGPDVDLAAARSELAVLGAAINRDLPSDPGAPEERVSAWAATLNEARADRAVKRSLLVLMGAVGLLHLLACANVVNLLLGRAASKRRDSAVRLALGSSDKRLFGHVFGEGFAMAVLGGAAGIAFAALATGLVTPPTNVWAPRSFYGSLAPFDTPAFGLFELGFGVCLTILTAVIVAIPPALSAIRLDVSSGIRAGSRGLAVDGLSLKRPSARGVLVGVEAALAMLLVVAAGLLIESFERMRRAGTGVQTESVLTFRVAPSEARVPASAAPAFVTRLLDAASNVPGVISATVDGGAPLSGSARSTLHIAGRESAPEGQAPSVLRHYVGPDHFKTLGIPLRVGRAFLETDGEGSPRVTVISEGAARRFWPNQDPLGQRVWFGSPGSVSSLEQSAVIVGVVGDVVYSPLDQTQNFASFYTPYAQFTYASRMVFLKTAGDPLAVVSSVRAAIATVDPELAMRDVRPLTEVANGSWARQRLDAFLFGSFGAAALLLAASGIFAVLSYAVATRSREFGVRIALGATSFRLLQHVLRQGMVFPVIGLVLGTLGSLGATRLLQASLYEVSPQEPRVLIGTALLLLLVSAIACFVPAWRATRTDPIEALRSE